MTAWMDRAACRGHDPELFFSPNGNDVDLALAICGRCPVVRECRAMAEATNAVGVWGGQQWTGRSTPRLLIDVLELLAEHGSLRAAERAAGLPRSGLRVAGRRISDLGWWEPSDGWHDGRLTAAGRGALDRHRSGEEVTTDLEFTRRTSEDTAAEFVHTADEHGGDVAIAAPRLGLTVDALEQALARARRKGIRIPTRWDHWAGASA